MPASVLSDCNSLEACWLWSDCLLCACRALHCACRAVSACSCGPSHDEGASSPVLTASRLAADLCSMVLPSHRGLSGKDLLYRHCNVSLAAVVKPVLTLSSRILAKFCKHRQGVSANLARSSHLQCTSCLFNRAQRECQKTVPTTLLTSHANAIWTWQAVV